MAKAELTTVENFKIVTGMEAMDEELRAELEDELDDLDDDGGIDAKHIKIPSGGGKGLKLRSDSSRYPIDSPGAGQHDCHGFIRRHGNSRTDLQLSRMVNVRSGRNY